MQKGFSFGAGVAAVITAFLAGLLVSLAIRPPGQTAAPAAASAGGGRQSISWRVPSAFNARLPVLGNMPAHMVRQLELATNGALKFNIFEPGELVPALAITDAVRAGKIQAGFTWVGYDQGWLPASTLLSAVPFGLEGMEFMAWWYDAGGHELGEQLYHEQGVHPVLCGIVGPETAGWFRQPIDSIEDLKGLKIRFAGLGGKVLQALGASVTLLAGSEIFQALEKGAIDATEFSIPAVDAMLGFDRVAKFNYFPGWHQPGSAMHLLVNLERWRGLDDAGRAAIDLACEATVARSIAHGEKIQPEALAQFAARGVVTGSLPDDILQALHEQSVAVLDAEAAANESFARILASQRAFQNSYKAWKLLGYLPRDF